MGAQRAGEGPEKVVPRSCWNHGGAWRTSENVLERVVASVLQVQVHKGPSYDLRGCYEEEKWVSRTFTKLLFPSFLPLMVMVRRLFVLLAVCVLLTTAPVDAAKKKKKKRKTKKKQKNKKLAASSSGE